MKPLYMSLSEVSLSIGEQKEHVFYIPFLSILNFFTFSITYIPYSNDSSRVFQALQKNIYNRRGKKAFRKRGNRKMEMIYMTQMHSIVCPPEHRRGYRSPKI